jgi:outer membrane protein OmpA-like peptidoglycan-associated protein
MKKKILFIALVFCFTVQTLVAQHRFHPWGIGVSYNATTMEGLLQRNKFQFRNYTGGIKLHVARYISPSFNARLEGAYSNLFYPSVTNYPQYEKGIFKQQSFFESSFLFEYKLNNNYVLKEDSYIQPYLFLGFGTNNMNKDWNTFFPFGVGLKLKCTKWLAINLETSMKVNIDNSFTYLQHNAGFVFNLGKQVYKKNGAQSKVKNDLKDLNTSSIIDTDKDGIADAQDECPFVAGISSLAGCPDTDGDGVADSKDLCPNEKGTIENNGCLPKSLDSDKDGIADNDDKCPYEAGVAQNNGCPIPVIDQIATEIVTTTKETTTFINNTTNGLELFYTVADAKLTDEHKKQLDAFALSILNTNYKKIKINGYTSNTGTDAINIKLSMDRAINVMNFLTSKGINIGKIGTYGYGPYSAKYNNSVPSESIKNQRVELIVE